MTQTMTTEIIPAEAQRELTEKKNSLAATVNEMVIQTRQDYDNATAFIKSAIIPAKERVKELFQPPVDDAKRAYDSARALRDTFLKPIEVAESIARSKGNMWLTAETARIEAERVAAAKAHESEIKKAERKAVKTGAPVILPPAPVMLTPKIEGTRTTWTAEVYDLRALCKAIGEGKAPIEAVKANTTILDGLARASKAALAIPGVKAISTTSGIMR